MINSLIANNKIATFIQYLLWAQPSAKSFVSIISLNFIYKQVYR